MKKKSTKKSVQKTKPNIHDEFVKAVFAHISLVIAFLRQYVDPELLEQLDLNRIKPEPTVFPGEEGHSRIADMVFSIPVKKKYRGKHGKLEVIFLFEHSSKRKRSLAFQILKYLVAFWNKVFMNAEKPESKDFFLPAPLLIVLHNGSRPIINKPTLAKMIAKIAGTEKYVPQFEYDIVDLPALTIEELGTAPLLRVILELLKRATDGTLSDVKTQILEPLTAIRDDEETRYWIKRILKYMDDVLEQENKRLTYEDVEQVIEPVYQEKSKEMSRTLFGEIEARGEARGEARAILTFLKSRFEREVPAAISKRILKINDLDVLDSLTQLAATCKTFDEFKKAVR